MKENKIQYHDWDFYNQEFLKHQFNNSENEYWYQYKHAADVFTMPIYGGGLHKSLNQKVKDYKAGFENKLRFLKKLVDSAELLLNLTLRTVFSVQGKVNG